MKSQTYRAFDKELINQKELEEMLTDIEKETNKIGAFMYYLRKSDFKGQKFKD